MSQQQRRSKSDKLPVILIVDDNAQNLELIQAYLGTSSAGPWSPRRNRGPDVVARTKPLVLLDDDAEDERIEVCRRRSDSATSDIPVIMVTALNDSDIERHRPGTDDFVSKPVNRLELLTRVRPCSNSASQRHAAAHAWRIPVRPSAGPGNVAPPAAERTGRDSRQGPSDLRTSAVATTGTALKRPRQIPPTAQGHNRHAEPPLADNLDSASTQVNPPERTIPVSTPIDVLCGVGMSGLQDTRQSDCR